VACLTVVLPPVVVGVANPTDGSVTLNMLTTTNVGSRVYCATNLAPPVVWQSIYTNFTGGAWQFTDTNTCGITTKFYLLSTP